MRSRSRVKLASAALLGLGALAAFSPQTGWCQTAPDSGASPAPAQTTPPVSTTTTTPDATTTTTPTTSTTPPPPPAPAPPQSYGAGDSGSVVNSGTTTTPAPPAPHYRKFSIGPEVGLYLPTDSKTRNRFGSTWFSVGLGFGDIVPPRHGGDVNFDLDFISQVGSNRHAYLIPIGVQYRQALNPRQTVNSESAVVPYVGVSADLVLEDVRSQVASDDAHSGLRTTGGGSIFIGTSLTSRAYIEARYFGVGSTEHFNLSGFDLTAGFRF